MGDNGEGGHTIQQRDKGGRQGGRQDGRQAGRQDLADMLSIKGDKALGWMGDKALPRRTHHPTKAHI